MFQTYVIISHSLTHHTSFYSCCHPSIYPSILSAVYPCPGSPGSWRKHNSPYVLHSNHVLQLFLWDWKAINKMGYVIQCVLGLPWAFSQLDVPKKQRQCNKMSLAKVFMAVPNGVKSLEKGEVNCTNGAHFEQSFLRGIVPH